MLLLFNAGQLHCQYGDWRKSLVRLVSIASVLNKLIPVNLCIWSSGFEIFSLFSQCLLHHGKHQGPQHFGVYAVSFYHCFHIIFCLLLLFYIWKLEVKRSIKVQSHYWKFTGKKRTTPQVCVISLNTKQNKWIFPVKCCRAPLNVNSFASDTHLFFFLYVYSFILSSSWNGPKRFSYTHQDLCENLLHGAGSTEHTGSLPLHRLWR